MPSTHVLGLCTVAKLYGTGMTLSHPFVSFHVTNLLVMIEAFLKRRQLKLVRSYILDHINGTHVYLKLLF
jgi:hypothetical protein